VTLNLGQGSFKVIENGTIQQIAYELAFRNNYGPIIYHFRDKTRYCLTIAIFSYSTCIRCPRVGAWIPVGILP